MIELGQLAPQIAIAVAIVGAAIILLRELRRNGGAISRRDLQDLREAFEQRKPTGAGLGLAAKVEAHTVQLDHMAVELTECRTDVSELRKGQDQILDHITRTNDSLHPHAD